MANFFNQDTTIIGLSAGWCWLRHPLYQLSRNQYYSSWGNVPTIISAWDSDLVGVRIPQTQDVREEKLRHIPTKWHCKILGKWTMGAGSWNNSSSLNKGEVRRWLIDSATIHWDFQKMDFHNNVNKKMTFVRSNGYNDVCSRKTYKIKHWLKGAPEIWVGLHDQCQNGDSIVNSLRMNFRPFTSKQ